MDVCRCLQSEQVVNFFITGIMVQVGGKFQHTRFNPIYIFYLVHIDVGHKHKLKRKRLSKKQK